MKFCVASGVDLPDTVRAIAGADLGRLDANDATASPVLMGGPFNLRLDWWKSSDRNVTNLKTWAGRMDSLRIAQAMQQVMHGAPFHSPDLFDVGMVVPDPADPLNKVEPFYFDARRGPNSHSRDVGFSVDELGMTTTAFPAVEFLCLVGLQRALPRPVPGRSRLYDYFLWPEPLESPLLPAAVNGLLPGGVGYRFESWYRTGQKKHKAFLTAKLQPST